VRRSIAAGSGVGRYRPEFFLDQERDILSELMDVEEFREERRARSDEAFLRRNVIFEPRNLIVL
jgi:hypothetical protein